MSVIAKRLYVITRSRFGQRDRRQPTFESVALRPTRVVLVAAVTLLAWTSVACASSGVTWGSGASIEPPTNAAASPDVVIAAVSCTVAGDCSAAGNYEDSGGISRGLLATETGGHWSQGVEATLPINANSDPDVVLNAISCISPGDCTAVGSFLDVNDVQQGIAFTEVNGAWGRGVEIYHPVGVRVTYNPRITLTSISCPSAGNCSVVGTYVDNDLHPEGMTATETSGGWSSSTYLEVNLPANAANEPNVNLNSVSCAEVGECDAVGSYVDSSGHAQGLLLTETGGVWQTGVEATLPANANTNSAVSLDSVSCPSVGSCTAVGSYNDSSQATQGLLLTDSGGTWQTGTRATLPGGAASDPGVLLNSVSCSSAGNCAAVGDYGDSSGDLQGFMLDETGGSWSQGVQASLPLNAGSPAVFVDLTQVSCISAGQCAAVGTYTDNEFSAHPLLLSQSGGSWGVGTEAVLPYVGSSPNTTVASVSCVATGDCVSLFSYVDNENNQLAAAANGTPSGLNTTTMSLATSPPVTGETGIALPGSDLTATLSGGTNEAGTVTFTVYGPQSSAPTSCAAGGTTVGTDPAQGNVSYVPTQSFTPTQAGDYWWYASYNGDLQNSPAGTTCGPAMAETIVSAPELLLTVPSTEPPDTTIAATSVNAALSGVTSGAQGTVTFTAYGPEASAPTTCPGSTGTGLGTAPVAGDGTYEPSDPFKLGGAGDYWWYASYSGDSANSAVGSTCGQLMAETVVPVATTLSLSAPSSAGAVGVGISPAVSAALSGGSAPPSGAAPSGSVTFTVFGPQASPPTSCTTGGAQVGTVTVQGDGTYAPAASFVPGAPGDYWWYASYSGDIGDIASATTCGSSMPKTVVLASPGLGITAPLSVVAGTAIPSSSIAATLASGHAETGTITVKLFGPQTSAPSSCASGGETIGTASVQADGTYHPSGGTTPSVPGDYWWYASYSGDSGNTSAASACGSGMTETVVTVPVNTTPTTSTTTNTSTTPPVTPATSTSTTTSTTAAAATIGTVLASFTNLKQHGHGVSLLVACNGPEGGTCTARLSLIVSEKLSGGKVVAVTASAKRPTPTITGLVTLGTAQVKLASGQSRAVVIRLTRAGAKLLVARGRLKLEVELLQGTHLTTRTLTVLNY